MDLDNSSPYDNKNDPKISIENYIDRWNQFAGVSPDEYPYILEQAKECIEKLINRKIICCITSRNHHRLISASFLICIKKHLDVHYSNSYYANVAGIPLIELNYLERTLLNHLDWDLN